MTLVNSSNRGKREKQKKNEGRTDREGFTVSRGRQLGVMRKSHKIACRKRDKRTQIELTIVVPWRQRAQKAGGG